jgi:RND family efflux transporter MFP subunit
MRESNHAVLERPAPAVIRAPAEAPEPRTPQVRFAFAGVLLGAVLGIAVFLGLHSRTAAHAELKRVAQDGLAIPVQVVHPEATAAAEEIALPGNAQAFSDTPIYARTSGYLKSWCADIGARVKQGQLLAEIETPEVDQQLGQAEAQLKNAEANLQLAQITAVRWESLYKKETVSHQERDQAVSDLASKQALVSSSAANVQRLQKLQSFEKIAAPFDGIITARNTDIGALIQAGDNTTPKELFHLVATQTLRVYVSIPEVYAASVKAGETVRATFDAFPGQNFSGKVVRDSGSIDQHSRTLNVEVDVENPRGALFPGGYATVWFKLPVVAGSVTIPANTLLFRAEGPRVAVMRNERAQLIPISIGHDFGNTLEIIAGLEKQDFVVMDPSDSLVDGDALRVDAGGAAGK